MANLCVIEKRYEEARRMLRPLMEQKTLHVSELASLCNAQLQLAQCVKSKEGKLWEAMWWQLEERDPDASRFRPAKLRAASGRRAAIA